MPSMSSKRLHAAAQALDNLNGVQDYPRQNMTWDTSVNICSWQDGFLVFPEQPAHDCDYEAHSMLVGIF